MTEGRSRGEFVGSVVETMGAYCGSLPVSQTGESATGASMKYRR